MLCVVSSFLGLPLFLFLVCAGVLHVDFVSIKNCTVGGLAGGKPGGGSGGIGGSRGSTVCFGMATFLGRPRFLLMGKETSPVCVAVLSLANSILRCVIDVFTFV